VKTDSSEPQIILASSSPYRKQLLERLRLKFDCQAPDIDESVEAGESAPDYVRRLAHDKAAAIAGSNPDAVVIGSDQCAVLDGQILGKPGSHENALRQLRAARGKTVTFRTAVCVMHAKSGFCEVDEVPFEVEFRELADNRLEHYLRVEQPYQCAGSFKAEGYGACLFRRMRGDDPSALIGLPLFRLSTMLESAGVEVV
jgi:septum formation protein